MDKKVKHDTNPFYPELSETAKFYYTEEEVRTDSTKIEFDEVTGELQDTVYVESRDHIFKQTIRTPFIRLMRHGIQKLATLPAPGNKLFWILSASISMESKDRDYVYLGFDHTKSMAEKVGLSISKVSYYKGIDALVEAGLIAKSTRTNIFWLNISMLFNGDFTKLEFVRNRDSTRRKLKEEGKLITYVPVDRKSKRG